MRRYLDGRNTGLYKADARQETTISLLQTLYDQLRKVHISHKRPSGLTTTEHIGTDKPRHSWYSHKHPLLRLLFISTQAHVAWQSKTADVIA